MKVLAVDANNVLIRAMHAAKRANLSSSDGVETGPLLLFINSLARHVSEEQPEYLGVAWDGGGRGTRREIDESYKANRRDAPDSDHELKHSSFRLAKQFCDLAGISQTEILGIEADDIIASWWARWTAGPVVTDIDRFVILSSDKDFTQLLGRSPKGVITEQIRLSSAGTPTDRWTELTAIQYFGCLPRYIPNVLALMGDTSDNVVGIRGVGPKKAVKALAEHAWDLADALNAKWPDEYARILQNLALVDLRTPWRAGRDQGIPEPPLPSPKPLTYPSSPDWDGLVRFLESLELRTVLDRLRAGRLWRVQEAPAVGRPLRA